MKKTLFMVLLGIYYSGYAQIITIKDNKTGQPIELVSIVSNQSQAFITSNSKGQADISIFKGAEKIQFRIMGYKAETKSYSEIESAGFKLSLVSSGISMEEIVVSATRSNQTSKDVPSKITTISSKDVALQNPQTAADLLSASGEVFIQKSQQGGGSPMIRGFSTNRLLYTIDGVRMNTAIFRGGNIQNVISLDPFATEKTEIFFGPGSVIYGSDAIGGVMSFQTITPQLTFNDTVLINGKAISRYSSANNEKTGHFDISLGWKKWALTTSISANDFDDLKMGNHGPDEYLRPFYVQRVDSTDVIVTNDDPRIQKPTKYSQINLMQKFRFHPNDKWDFQYGFHYSETSDYARYDRHIRYKNGLPRYGEWNYGPQKWMMNNLTISNYSDNKVYDQMIIRIAHQFFEESRIDRDINKNIRHIRIEKVNAYSINLDFTKRINAKHKLYYGIEGVLNQVNSSGIDKDISTGTINIGPSRYPQADWKSYAAYVNYHFKVSDKLIIQAGARYNQYQLSATFDTTFYPFPYTAAELNNGALTGSLGAVFRPTEKWAISAGLSSGFRSPNVDDAGKVFDSEPGYVITPNPNLKAENAYNAELGIAKLFGEILKIDITGYYTILQNAMVRRDFTLNGEDSILYDGTLSQVQSIQNAAVATVYGIQAGFDLKLKSGFGLSTDFNYQIGEEELDDGTISPSRHAPPMFGTTRIFYETNNVTIQLYSIYSGAKKFKELPQEEQFKSEIYAKDKDGKPWSPSWYTLNIKAMYQFTNNLSISAGVENLTDQRYRPYSSGIVAPGRNFILSLKAIF